LTDRDRALIDPNTDRDRGLRRRRWLIERGPEQRLNTYSDRTFIEPSSYINIINNTKRALGGGAKTSRIRYSSKHM
jgi:hypothetical protein